MLQVVVEVVSCTLIDDNMCCVHSILCSKYVAYIVSPVILGQLDCGSNSVSAPMSPFATVTCPHYRYPCLPYRPY